MQRTDSGSALRPWLGEARALVALALPLVAGNLAWSTIAATDLLLLGRLGSRAVAAGALALNIYTAFMIFGIGLTNAASPLIAAERGRRRHSVRDIRRTVRQTLWAGAMICVPSWLILWHGEALLILLGQEPALATEAGKLLRGLQWALLPYFAFLTLRNFVTALERPLSAVIVIALTIPVNLAAGWILIFGKLGMPALGLFGAGLASTLSSLFMLAAMILAVLTDRNFRRYHLFGRLWVPDWPRFRAVWRIGLPIAVIQGLEVTVFNAAVFLMGLIDAASLAAHAVAIQIASLSFMVPMGIGQAGTVRVGLAYGRGDHAALGRAGWSALALGALYALVAAAIILAVPQLLVSVFLDVAAPANAEVVRLACIFLAVAAVFQLSDCIQAIGAGILRGIQDTRVPMIFAGIGYWVIGIGVGTALAFPLGMKGTGVWIGLATGLTVVAVLLLARWHRREALIGA
ncbi:MATE family efflux transporter [Sphingomonas quercus]|uniref:MATE family efflux transporter n=1 Tax=Sphingomonas quercus TaxID=2842451 RepID=A0ABS6BLJ6_9SPHN|nr:MATE family efflux transporter [Sphingomonas quercus]MBU3079198.1 MATE family efflux transporter [Sphingomonas quercus]